MGVGAVHDGAIIGFSLPFIIEAIDNLEHIVRFIRFVVCFMEVDQLSFTSISEKFLALTSRMFIDDGHRQIQNVLCGTVILLQQDRLSFWIVLLKTEHIAVIGSTPTVNGLIRITNHKNVGCFPGQQLQQYILRRIGILKFVHQDMLIIAAVGISHRLMISEQTHHEKQEVVEIEGITHQKLAFVDLINSFHDFIEITAGRKLL